MNRVTVVGVLVAATLLLMGCQQGSFGDAAPGASSVSISSISPLPGKCLKVGDRVEFGVDISYHLDADSGTVSLVVQSADGKPISSNMEVVTRGSGHVTLRTEIQVPNTNAIQVFTPLNAQGQISTTTADMRSFRVES